MRVTPRWWWSHTRKYLWECEESRRFHQYLWELSDHGHNPIHLATIVNSRHVPDWVES